MDNKEFYVYVWEDEEGKPYYVGKGSGDRAYSKRPGEVEPPLDRGRVRVYPCDNEEAAFDFEGELISRYGRLDRGTGCLENRSNGGEGWSRGIADEAPRKTTDKFSKRVLMVKVPDVVAMEEDLYYVMQCAAKGALCRFINSGMESDELANELYIRWKETGLSPAHRRATYKGKPTKPAKSATMPMNKWDLYHIFKSDFLDILYKNKRRADKEQAQKIVDYN